MKVYMRNHDDLKRVEVKLPNGMLSGLILVVAGEEFHVQEQGDVLNITTPYGHLVISPHASNTIDVGVEK